MRRILINPAAMAAIQAASVNGIPVASGTQQPNGGYEIEVDEEVFEKLSDESRKRGLEFSDLILEAAQGVQ